MHSIQETSRRLKTFYINEPLFLLSLYCVKHFFCFITHVHFGGKENVCPRLSLCSQFCNTGEGFSTAVDIPVIKFTDKNGNVLSCQHFFQLRQLQWHYKIDATHLSDDRFQISALWSSSFHYIEKSCCIHAIYFHQDCFLTNKHLSYIVIVSCEGYTIL